MLQQFAEKENEMKVENRSESLFQNVLGVVSEESAKQKQEKLSKIKL